MKLILAGGGDANQSKEVDDFFVNLLPNKTLVYLPQAISPEIWDFEKSLQWLKSHESFDSCSITMWEELYYHKLDDFLEFDAIYLMGGNTFKLLNEMRTSKLSYLLADLIEHMVVYGISAGAIVLGATIHPAETGPEKDENYLNISDLRGQNYLNEYLVATHFIPETSKELISLSCEQKKKIIAIPETSGVYVNNEKCLVIGRDSVFVFNEDKISEYKKMEQFELL